MSSAGTEGPDGGAEEFRAGDTEGVADLLERAVVAYHDWLDEPLSRKELRCVKRELLGELIGRSRGWRIKVISPRNTVVLDLILKLPRWLGGR